MQTLELVHEGAAQVPASCGTSLALLRADGAGRDWAGAGGGGALPLWVCGSHVGPCGQARACSWAFPVWCKDQDGGLRLAESGLQPPHTARSWSKYLGLAWAAFQGRRSRHKGPGKSLHHICFSPRTGQFHSETRGQGGPSSGKRFAGAKISWPALGIRGMERAQRNLGS